LPSGLFGLNFPLHLFTVDQFTALGLQIPFLYMLARMYAFCVVPGQS